VKSRPLSACRSCKKCPPALSNAISSASVVEVETDFCSRDSASPTIHLTVPPPHKTKPNSPHCPVKSPPNASRHLLSSPCFCSACSLHTIFPITGPHNIPLRARYTIGPGPAKKEATRIGSSKDESSKGGNSISGDHVWSLLKTFR
jgi:hypothetical protein